MTSTNISELENIFSSLSINPDLSSTSITDNTCISSNLNSPSTSIAESTCSNLRLSISNNFIYKSYTEVLDIMAPPHFDLKILDIVPKFEGDTNELAAFLEISQTLIITYWDATNVASVQNILLINGIYAKLIGRARSVYCNCISKDWDNVKKTLIAHFGDQRNESGLLMDLGNLKQSPNEPSLQFLNRVMNILNALHNYIDIHEGNAELKILKKQFYQEHGLNVLLSGLRDPQGPIIRSMKPNNLAEAQQFIITDNNIRYQQRGFSNPNQGNKFNHTHNNHSKTNPNTQKFTPYIPQASFSPNIRPNMPHFPTGPINTQPRPTFPQRPFVNRQIPGTSSSNVFRPRNDQNFPRPTPMSGISTSVSRPNNTNLQPNRNFPQFNQQRQPRYTFEELHNIEGQEIIQNQYPETDQRQYNPNTAQITDNNYYPYNINDFEPYQRLEPPNEFSDNCLEGQHFQEEQYIQEENFQDLPFSNETT